MFYERQKEGDVILLIEFLNSNISQSNQKFVIHKGTVAGVCFSNETLRKEFIKSVKEGQVTNTNVRLGVLSLKDNYVELKRKIDFISDELIESSLSCREYVYMYCMLRQGFNNTIEERLDQMMEIMHVNHLMEQKIGDLSKGQQILIRSIAAYLLDCKIIVLQNGNGFNTENEKKTYIDFLEFYVKWNGICLILSTKMNELRVFTQEIYRVD